MSSLSNLKAPMNKASRPETEIECLLREQARQIPDAVAIVAPGREPLTYAGLLEQVENAVRTFHQLGLERRDRVALVLSNGPEIAVCFVALASAFICAPLNPASRTNEFDFYLSDLKAKALIVEAGSDSPARTVAMRQSIPVIELSPAMQTAGVFNLTCPKAPVAFEDGFGPAEEVALILYTSGTTSRPKMVPLTHSNLLASAGNIAAGLRLTRKDLCLNVMPLFHIHGLVGALLSSVVAGGSVVCTPGFNAEEFLQWLEVFRPTWYTAVPTLHQAIVGCTQAAPRRIVHSLRFIRSCSAPLPAKLSTALEETFGVPIIEAYGMTEAAHQVASNPLPPSERKMGSVGRAAGPDIAIADGAGVLLPIGHIGEVMIRGKSVMSGYDGDRATNTASFIGEWFRTGDQGYLDSDGYLFLTGRLKEVVNRGGEKISLAEIDAVLLEHPQVFQAAAFPVPHSTLGEDLAAAIVVVDRGLVTEPMIREYLFERLAAFKLPTQIYFVDNLPKSSTGKIQRTKLAEIFARKALAADQCRPELEKGYVAPRTPVEEMIAEIWAEVLKLDTVGVHDNFFDLGGHSLLATQATSRICQALKVEVPLRALFERPTVAELAKRIEEAAREDETPSTPPLVPVSRDKDLPISFSQQRLWFLDQYEPNSSVYNIPSALRLRGSLNVAALEQSLNELIRRHESLRTTFSTVNAEPVQVFAPSVEFALAVVDLRDHPESEREEEARQLAREEAGRPFDLARGPLFRSKLLRLDEDDYVLLLTMHHIVSDGWSTGVLYRELSVLYRAFVKGESSPLPELPIQYGDYAVWQRQWLQGKVLESQLSYWRKQLEDIPGVLNLPTDRPRPAVQSFRGKRQSIELSRELTQGLKALSRKQGVTLFMTLLVAFQTLLYRYSGQEDVVVGSPIANRNRAEMEGLIGFFVNTLVLRTDLSDTPTFRELLQRVRKTALEAYEHQDLPFEKLVEELQPERSLSHSPLFQVMFVLQNAPSTALTFEGLSASPVRIGAETAKFDLTLSMSETVEGLRGSLQYSTDLFDGATIARMSGHLQTLLEGIAANPDQRISQLPILTQAEEHQLLVEWNDTQRSYPSDKCIHELFEMQVEKTPDAVAVTFEDQQLTYRELNIKANQLAHHLRKLGVGPEVLVGVCMERSLEMVVALLGILKSGSAYLPLDPAYPEERLRFMLEDSRVEVLLTMKKTVEDRGWRIEDSDPQSSILERRIQIVCLDRDAPIIEAQSVDNPNIRVDSENLAYVIYTSGSTGKPKGAMIEHRSLVNYLFWVNANLLGDAVQSLPLITNLTFDACLKQLFAPLLGGRGIRILSRQVTTQPRRC